jgi:hypothetical protein
MSPSEDHVVPRRKGQEPRDARMTIRLTRTLREGIDRAAARDRRLAVDWIHVVLEDAVAASDAKAAEAKTKGK